MAYDYRKLLGKIVERFSTQSNFSEAMGLSEHSLSNKINGKVGWKQDEIIKAAELLSIRIEEIPDYFFTLIVQNFEQKQEA